MRKSPILLLLLLCTAPGAMACDCSVGSESSPSGWMHLAPFAVIMIALFAMTLSGLDVWESIREFFATVGPKPNRAD